MLATQPAGLTPLGRNVSETEQTPWHWPDLRDRRERAASRRQRSCSQCSRWHPWATPSYMFTQQSNLQAAADQRRSGRHRVSRKRPPQARRDLDEVAMEVIGKQVRGDGSRSSRPWTSIRKTVADDAVVEGGEYHGRHSPWPTC